MLLISGIIDCGGKIKWGFAYSLTKLQFAAREKKFESDLIPFDTRSNQISRHHYTRSDEMSSEIAFIYI